MTSSSDFRGPPTRLIVVMPVFRDWALAREVCVRLDRELLRVPHLEASVLLVDDGSPDGLEGFLPFRPTRIARVEALRLRRNVGHQRAIAIGLCIIHDDRPCDAVLVMDADGEDRPEDAFALFAELERSPKHIVFAQRRRRMEGLVFRLGYMTYRALHRVLTGVSVHVGNFSVLPRAALTRLVWMAELWNHYSGAVFRSKFPYRAVPIDRGGRLGGQSQMGGVVGLVIHGISGIATFHDVVATRILLASIASMLLLGLTLAALLALRFCSTIVIPSWAANSVGVVLVLSVQLGSMAFGLVFSLITGRIATTFVPARDYRPFVGGVDLLGARADAL